MSQYITLATCSINQMAMDFEGNKKRIISSIQQAKAKGARFRLGPELEIPGYGCEDHFQEPDTFTHSLEVLAEILADPALTKDIVCDIGLPVYHNSIPYNCRVLCLDGKVLGFRPKQFMANDGNYRELRWFCRWQKRGQVESFKLPPCIQAFHGQEFVPFGDWFLETKETKISPECCEELFTPNNPHILQGLVGVEIFTNASGSHHQLRKLNKRMELIQNASGRSGGVYVYSNMIGCDGGRLNYDGAACISVNGSIVNQARQFSLCEVEVITSTIDLEEVRRYRLGINSRNVQASNENIQVEYVSGFTKDNQRQQSISTTSNCPKALYVGFSLASPSKSVIQKVAKPIPVFYHRFEEEIANGGAQWCWDYLRRSGANGFLLPLSGGADSSSSATIIGNMCRMVVEEVNAGNKQVLSDVQRIVGNKNYVPKTPKELCGRVLYTTYMGTTNSSQETRNLATGLAGQLGSSHYNVDIQKMVDSVLAVFGTVMRTHLGKAKTPQYHMNGKGSPTEDKALQNIQARLRMVFAYLMAQLIKWAHGERGWLLVLGSSNVDEGLRGYLTKYDCSSADLNPIGGICKDDLKSFLSWAGKTLGYSKLLDILAAPPSAELKPPSGTGIQKDEDEMGMSYADLTLYGKLRKISKCGPVSMFKNLVQEWAVDYGSYRDKTLTVREVGEKVKTFFRFYSMNRHKMTTLTPSVHMENYSPEDNRHDLRQIFYNVSWPFQFRKIDEIVVSMETGGKKGKAVNGRTGKL